MIEQEQKAPEAPEPLTAKEYGILYNFFYGMVQDLTSQLEQTGADNLQFRVQLKSSIEQAKSLCFKLEALGKQAVEEHNAKMRALLQAAKEKQAALERAKVFNMPPAELDKSLTGK